MMKKYFTLIICLLSFVRVYSQGYHVEVQIENLIDQQVYLMQYHQSRFSKVDSAESVNGNFYFYFEDEMPAGMYQISFTSHEKREMKSPPYIDFLWNKESFSIYANYKSLSNSVLFDNSIENSLLSEFREYESIYNQKMSVLFQVIDEYPEDDAYLNVTEANIAELQIDRDSMLNQMIALNPVAYASKIIASYRSVSVSADMKGMERVKFMRQHFFDLAPIDDAALLYAPIYAKKIIEYLTLNSNSSLTFSEQEDLFIEAIDVIMANVSGDIDLRAFVVDYLLKGFESFGMEKVQTYIVDNYIDETCVTDAVELAKHRVEAFKKLAEGQIGKDIFIKSIENEMVRLSEDDAEYTLLIFWATHCEHCVKMMPKLKDWYDNDKPENLEVFAVSIDTVKTNWEMYVNHFQLPWINTHEPMGWEGRSAEDYNIYATPTIFLLDRNRKILAKPLTMREVKREVGKLEEEVSY